MVLYLDRMCQCGLHAVLWSHVGRLMHRFAEEPRSIAGLLFPSQCSSGTILQTVRFQEQGRCFVIGLSCSIPTIRDLGYYFSLSLLSVYWLVLWG